MESDGDATDGVSLPDRDQTGRNLLDSGASNSHATSGHQYERRRSCNCSFRGGFSGSFLIGKPPLAKSRWRMRFAVRFSLVREASPNHGK